MTNRTTSPIDSILVGTKSLDPLKMTQPTGFPEKTGKGHVPEDTDPDPSLSELSLKKRNKIIRKIVGNTGKMTRQTHRYG